MRMKGLSPLVMLRDIERGALTKGEHVLGDLLLRARSPLGIETPLLSRFFLALHLTWLLSERVLEKETEHFPSSVRPSRIGIGSGGAASRPSVAGSMDIPLL